MTRIDIPAALRDEIAADLEAGGDRAERWRPDTAADVLILAADNPHAVGMATKPRLTLGTAASLTEIIATATFDWATAWAPAGGVDGGPRPVEGDRILVLTDAGGDCPEPWIGHVTYASWGNLPIGAVMADGRTHLAAEESAVTRWAILPPEVPDGVRALRVDLDQALDVGTGLAQIIGPDQPVDPLTANPDHAWPCADYCCTRGCPGIGNTLHGPPWPCDATRCTCGNTVIRAVAHDRQRLAALVPGLETANHGLHNRNRALRDERDRARRIAVALEQELAQLRSRILDRLRDQGLNIDYLAEPDTREQT